MTFLDLFRIEPGLWVPGIYKWFRASVQRLDHSRHRLNNKFTSRNRQGRFPDCDGDWVVSWCTEYVLCGRHL